MKILLILDAILLCLMIIAFVKKKDVEGRLLAVLVGGISLSLTGLSDDASFFFAILLFYVFLISLTILAYVKKKYVTGCVLVFILLVLTLVLVQLIKLANGLGELLNDLFHRIADSPTIYVIKR